MSHSPAFLKIVEEAKSKIKEYSVDEVQMKMNQEQGVTLIDCREESEWKKAHIKGAVYVGKGVVERDIEKLYEDKNLDLIFYCGGGFRSALVCENLQRMGYKNVSSMDGGWSRWNDKGYEVEKLT